MKTFRAVFLCGFALTGLLVLLLSVPEGAAQTQTPEAVAGLRTRMLAADVGDGFTVSAMGDLIIQHPQSMRDDPGFKSLVQILKSSDVAFGNMEGTIGDMKNFRGYPAAKPDIGSFFFYDADVARDLKTMGFTMVGRANNHSADWGAEGMLGTDHLLDMAGIVHAGSGKQRAEARAPAYQETSKGRVALVSMASSLPPGTNIPTETDDEGVEISAAAPPVGEAPGRPGVNALRVMPYVLVTSAEMQALRGIHDALPKGSVSAVRNPNEMQLFGIRYRVSDHTGFTYEANPQDLREILQSIRAGKEDSNFLIATIHSHDPGNWSIEPPDFMPALAHAAIDNGADMFIGHGPHRLRGIEIYKGRPIFYGLGNFFFEENQQQPTPADSWEETGVDPENLTDPELAEQRRRGRGVEQYESVIAVARFEQGQLSEIRLYPVFLGGDATRDSDRGIPHPASPVMAQTILEGLQQASKPFGTIIEITQNVGIIRLPAANSGQPAVPGKR